MNAAILCVVILLHTPDGKAIYVESTHIRTIRAPDHHCAPRSSALIQFDVGGSLCVMETPTEIQDKVHQ
jgi:hypothetical protein